MAAEKMYILKNATAELLAKFHH